MHPINNVRVLKHLKLQFDADEEGVNAWYRHWISEGFGGLESYLATSGKAGAYCHGDAVSMADLCLVPQVFNARRFDCPLDAYPLINAIVARCMAVEAFHTTQPSVQADAF
jgi:maleylacetoacetate isomerase